MLRDTCAVVAQDRHTTWLGACPMPRTNTTDTACSLKRVVGPQFQPGHVDTYVSGAIDAVTTYLGSAAVHDTLWTRKLCGPALIFEELIPESGFLQSGAGEIISETTFRIMLRHN